MHLVTAAILKGWKSFSPGLRGTSYPGGLSIPRPPTLKGLHQPSTAAVTKCALWLPSRDMPAPSSSLSQGLINPVRACLKIVAAEGNEADGCTGRPGNPRRLPGLGIFSDTL